VALAARIACDAPAAVHRLRHQIGPMLARTGGAVVTELLEPQRMAVSLVYADRKFNYELNSRLHQASAWIAIDWSSATCSRWTRR
jgi:hypothetical protein